MENEVLKLAATQGLWAVMFVILLYYILRSQEKRDIRQEEREKKYQELLQELTEKFKIVSEIKEDVEDIVQALKNKTST